MTKKKNNNNNKQVSSGYTPKRIPQGMIHVGTTSDGTKIYSASAQIMKFYYPDLYKMRPNRTNYIFIGNNGVYTPISSSNDIYDKFIDRNLLRYNTQKSTQDSRTINDKNAKNNQTVSTLNTVPASAYDEKSPIVAPNIEKYTYCDPVNVRARDIALSKDIQNRMFQNNLLEGALLFGGPPLIALGLSNPATALPTIGGLAGYMGGSYALNKAWQDYVSPEHNTFDYDFGNAVVQPIRELIGDKNKASITDKNATIVGSLLNPIGWLGAKGGSYGGKQLNQPVYNTYNSVKSDINNFSLQLPDSQYLKYINVSRPLPGEVVYTRPTSGFMMKPLMEGNPLEAQMNEYGDISAKAIRSYINGKAKGYQQIMQDALNSFGDQKMISYNQFKQAVYDRIPKFTKIPQEKFKNYGLDRLGYMKLEIRPNEQGDYDILPVEGSEKVQDKQVYTFEDLDNTYPYRYYDYRNWPMNRHFDGDPLAHSRSFVPNDNPQIRAFPESQSDWAQNVLLGNPRSRIIVDNNTGLTNVIKNSDGTYTLNEALGNIKDQDFMPGQKLERYGSIRIAFPKDAGYLPESELTSEVVKMFETPTNDPVLQHMVNTYEQRLLYENMKTAVEKGQNKIWYPTPETAIKIQNYEKQLPQEALKEITNLRNSHNSDVDALQQTFNRTRPDGYMNKFQRAFRRHVTMTSEEAEQFREIQRLSEQWDNENIANFKKQKEKIDKYYSDQMQQIEDQYKDKMAYTDEHKRVLRRYAEFPNMFKKLFPNQEIRTITDNLGNSWYEMDVPNNFMDTEWQFAKGGTIHRQSKLIPKRNLYNI